MTRSIQIWHSTLRIYCELNFGNDAKGCFETTFCHRLSLSFGELVRRKLFHFSMELARKVRCLQRVHTDYPLILGASSSGYSYGYVDSIANGLYH